MILKIYKKYKEVINYLIAGFCTVIVSIATYAFFTKIFNVHYIVSNVISWIIAVIFAYYVNSKFVFESVTVNKDKIYEIINFFKYRILSLLIETLLMYILVDLLIINDMISKFFVQIVVIVLNYLFSKFLIFNKK